MLFLCQFNIIIMILYKSTAVTSQEGRLFSFNPPAPSRTSIKHQQPVNLKTTPFSLHSYRKPLKLPRPCFPMARQCVKLRRTNPPTLGKRSFYKRIRGQPWRPVRGTFFLYSKSELGVLSRSTAVTEQRVAFRPTHCMQ